MISATSLNAPSPLNKGHQIPLGLENGRLRVDSQFLVPSLPVSARAVGIHNNDPKRRERSIVNGTAHPHPHPHPVPPPNSNEFSHHHHPSLSLSHNYQNLNMNGFRSSYPHPHGGVNQDTNPRSPQNNNHRTSSSPHHPYLHLNNSPRKDAHSPMYAGEVPVHGHSPGGGGSGGGNYSHRLSMPIPCSSPAAASSASPKGAHSSHSPSSTSGNYSPKLPSGPSSMLPPPSELNSLANAAGRLYPGFPPPHPSVAAHLSPAFYAAAAAAAASHSLPYPIFGVGPSFNPHSHSAAAASAYLDSFHSALVHRGPTSNEIQQHQNQRSRSPSPSPPNRNHGSYHHSAQPHPQQHSQSHTHPHNHPMSSSSSSTSVTSLHNKLIESTTVSNSDRDRHGYNDGHNHHGHNNHHQHVVPIGQGSPQSLGLSKGGPLGISGGIMNLPSSRLSNGTNKHDHSPQQSQQPQPENLVVHKSAPQGSMNGYHLSSNSKQWLEHHGLNPNDPMNRKLVLELEARHNQNDNGLQQQQQLPHKQQRVRSQSPLQDVNPKISKSITFASDTYPKNHVNNNNYRHHNPIHGSNIHHHNQQHAYSNGHLHMQRESQLSNNVGILTDSNAKKQVNNNHLQNNNLVHNSPQQSVPSHHSQPNSSSSGQFLPPSPKKRAAQWTFAVPANPGSRVELPPPPPPPPLSHNFTQEQIKYLNNSNQNLNHNKPSTNPQHHSLPVPNSAKVFQHSTSSGGQQQQQAATAQHNSYPSSPRLPGSGPSTPKSPAVHSVKFSFSSGSSKENLRGGQKQGGGKSGRNDSSSSSSSNEGNVPWPVEKMPILEHFQAGSLIKLANGDLRPVEDLKAEDFIHSAAHMSASLKIIHCTVLSIQQSDNGNNGNSSMCKVTMMIGSRLHNQQVIVPSSPEQPFFVLGRGWSSLSPKRTEKLLQLPCCSLAVGDVCITLSKPTPTPTLAPVPAPKGAQVSKSPSTRGRKPGSGRGGSNAVGSPTTKRAMAAAAASRETLLKNSGEIQGVKPAPESIKRHSMGPPLTASGSSNVTPKVTKKEAEIGMDNLLRPPSPKRRRWSAPEPEILVPATLSTVCETETSIKTDNGEVEQKNKSISLPLTPSSDPPCQKTSSLPPVVKKEEEDMTAIDKDKGEKSTDVNSNLNVKDDIKINVSTAMELNVTSPSRGSSSSDAQSAKA